MVISVIGEHKAMKNIFRYKINYFSPIFLCFSLLLVTDSYLIVLREIPERKGAAHVIVKRPLTSIVKITSRKRHADLITFKYGTTQYNDTVISDMDKFLIPNASEATKLITQQIMKQLKTSD